MGSVQRAADDLGQGERRIALHGVAGAGHRVHLGGGAAAEELLGVLVGDESGCAAANEGQRCDRGGYVVPQRRKIVQTSELVIAPFPAAVLALAGVVPDAPPDVRQRAVRCGCGGQCHDLLKGREAGWPLDQRGGAALGPGHRLLALICRRGDVHDHRPGYQVRGHRGQSDCGQATQRHAHDHFGAGCPLADQRDDVRGRRPGHVVMVRPPAGVPVTGQVDRERGQAQREDHRVPGVGVLAAAVQEYHPG
jgi:hypothetical protein